MDGPARVVSVSEQKIVNDAYHGTKASAWPSIQKIGLRPSEEAGFLGVGVYFYQGPNGFEKAKWWADKRFRPEARAIIKAQIELGNCFDYSDEKSIGLIAKTAALLKKQGKNVNEAGVVSAISEHYKCDTVIATYSGKRPMSGSRFVSDIVNYLLVRNLDNIRDLSMILTWS
jgi:hypothetical protein